MNPNKSANYLNRDFFSIRKNLLDYVKVYYPDQYNDFSEASIGMMLIELNAYVGDLLSYHVDQKANELFLSTAKERNSVISLAENLGFFVKGKKAAVTMLDVSIIVPVLNNAPDPDYLVTLKSGFQAKTQNGSYFEVLENIDFSSHYNLSGAKNRTIVPNYNSNNDIINYTVTKSVIARAGQTLTSTLQLTSSNVKPFMEWNINDASVVEILNVVDSAVSSLPDSEEDWTDYSYTNNEWFQVDYLAQNSVFVDTSFGQTAKTRSGYWKPVDRRFIVKYDADGNAKLIFGAGTENFDLYSSWLQQGYTAITSLAKLLDSNVLGVMPPIGKYLHIRYRSGGGALSNAPVNSIKTIVKKDLYYAPPGANFTTLNQVLNTVTCNNSLPALGGADLQTTEEIRNIAPKYYAAQERCVTLDDYISRIYSMPSQYGSIFRAYAENESETYKTKLYILTRDENGKLQNSENDIVKRNIASYLEQYRILNDFIEIYDGKVINIAIDFTVHVEKAYNAKEVLINCMNSLKDYFDVSNWNMNDKIYLSQVVELLRKVPGVINVVDLTFKNKIGGNYSTDVLPNTTYSSLSDTVESVRRGETSIMPVNNTIASSPTSMFEIKYPEKDIQGRVV